MDLTIYENVIIKLLFTNEDIRGKIFPHLTPVIFDDLENVGIVKTVLSFYDKYESFPTVSDIKLEISDQNVLDRLTNNINLDISEYSYDLLLTHCETFLRTKLAFNYMAECAVSMKDEKWEVIGQYPDKLREAIAFTFNTNVGYDYFDDPDRMYDFLHDKDEAVPFCLDFLDRCTGGGAHKKALHFFLAETNLGKTMIMSSCATSNILNGKNVLYITCEMAENKIAERVTAKIFSHDINTLKDLSRVEFGMAFEKVRKTIKSKLLIKEYPPAKISANDIRNLLKEIEVKKGFKPDIIYMDYIELMVPIYAKKADNSYNEYKRVAEELRAVAVEYAVPIVSAIQVNREGTGSSGVGLKHVADSMGMAFTGDIVVSVTQSQELRELGKFSMKFLKNRFGINLTQGLVKVDYPRMSIYNDVENDLKMIEKSIDTPTINKSIAKDVFDGIGILSRTITSNSAVSTAIEWD